MSHSNAYVKRLKNPHGRYKNETEHIQHVIDRLQERFGIYITMLEYFTILQQAQKKCKLIYKLSSCNAIWEVEIKGQVVWLIYGSKSNDDLPARFKTALIPFTLYPVPYVLADFYDINTFTIQINRIIESFKYLAKEIDLDDKKTFFSRTDISSNVKGGALYVKQHGEETTTTLVRMAINEIKFNHEISN